MDYFPGKFANLSLDLISVGWQVCSSRLYWSFPRNRLSLRTSGSKKNSGQSLSFPCVRLDNCNSQKNFGKIAAQIACVLCIMLHDSASNLPTTPAPQSSTLSTHSTTETRKSVHASPYRGRLNLTDRDSGWLPWPDTTFPVPSVGFYVLYQFLLECL